MFKVFVHVGRGSLPFAGRSGRLRSGPGDEVTCGGSPAELYETGGWRGPHLLSAVKSVWPNPSDAKCTLLRHLRIAVPHILYQDSSSPI